MDGDGENDGTVDGGVSFDVHGETISVENEGLGAKLTEQVTGLAVVAVSNQKIISTTIAVAAGGLAGVTGERPLLMS